LRSENNQRKRSDNPLDANDFIRSNESVKFGLVMNSEKVGRFE